MSRTRFTIATIIFAITFLGAMAVIACSYNQDMARIQQTFGR